MTLPAQVNPFAGISPGDEVRIEWRKKPNGARDGEGYGEAGTVLQVTDRLVQIRHPLGYTYCVNLSHIVTRAAKITVLNRKEEGKVEEQVWYDPRPDEQNEQAGLLTPLDCVRKGLPLEQACTMTPDDFTEDVAKELLAAGVQKSQLCRLFRLSVGALYYKLGKWGLHKGRQDKATAEEPVDAQPAEQIAQQPEDDVPAAESTELEQASTSQTYPERRPAPAVRDWATLVTREMVEAVADLPRAEAAARIREQIGRPEFSIKALGSLKARYGLTAPREIVRPKKTPKTLDEALKEMGRLEANLKSCAIILDRPGMDSMLTDEVRDLLQRARDGWENQLARLRNARVVV